MSNDELNELLGKLSASPSFEILPPIEMDGRCRIIGVSRYPKTREIDISFYTIPIEEKDIRSSERSEIKDMKSIKIKYEDLTWLAPKLEGLREFLGIENGFDRF